MKDKASRPDNIKNRIMNFLYPPMSAGHLHQRVTESLSDDKFYGRMNDPTSSGCIKGPCGDSMEFYLVIEKDIITDVKYYTEGCGNTRSCGYAAARRAINSSIVDALCISPGDIIRSGECLPEEGRHCAILAVSTLYRAIADYLLQP